MYDFIIYIPPQTPQTEPRQATLREMELRTEKSIALHILQENTPYLRGNTGRTHLAPLPGLPPFVDDIYVYGRLEEKDTVQVGARLSCTTGPNGAAARTVSQISLFARAVWPPEEHKWIHVSIANTVATNSGTRIPQTIEGIEEEYEGRLANTWAAIHGGARAGRVGAAFRSFAGRPAPAPVTTCGERHGIVPS